MQSLTHHARARMQQREAIEALLDFGYARHLHSKGRELVFFDKKARARLAQANHGAAREAGRLLRTYAILGSDGTIITVGHRYRRVGRV
jgi:sigma54-dependent transcription regulator